MPGKAHAVVVWPAARGDRGMPPVSPQHRRWLARGRVVRVARGELLSQVLPVLDMVPPLEGFGALRLWGQTGTRPPGWVAAADPVFLEARLDHLVLHRIDAQLDDTDVLELFEELQRKLATDGTLGFTCAGTLGYVHRDRPMTTARGSPSLAQGDSPGDFMPTGEQARAHDRLQGEVQMSLYESDVNRRRADAGKPPVNALWIWGGGYAPRPSEGTLPQLYSDDPLFRGYWRSMSAAADAWPADLSACLESSPGRFVAVLPEASAATELDAHLAVLRRMLQRGRLRSVTLVFGDGLRADIDRWDALRLWRRDCTFLEENGSA
jgi:hypothetical protein